MYHNDISGNVSQNFIISTKDIWRDTWSDPVLFYFHGLDTSLFFDQENRAFIQGGWALNSQGQPRTTIKQVEIDIHTGKLLSDTKEIWTGFAKYDSEGPHMYLKDGYYYLLIAEGGTFEHHMLTIARSKSIWGPFESHAKNPILTADGTKEYIQNVGHGDIFQDATGEWWAVVLGVRNRHDRFPLGRETFLTRVS